MSKLNNDLCNRIPAISTQSYHVLETLKESGVQDSVLLRKEIVESYKEFSNGLFDLFKRYSRWFCASYLFSGSNSSGIR